MDKQKRHKSIRKGRKNIRISQSKAHVRFLVVFVLYNSSDLWYWKRYGSGEPVYIDYLKKRIPLSIPIKAYKEVQEQDSEYKYRMDEVYVFGYAVNKPQAIRRAIKWDTFKILGSDDKEKEFYSDAEKYRKFANGRIYKKFMVR